MGRPPPSAFIQCYSIMNEKVYTGKEEENSIFCSHCCCRSVDMWALIPSCSNVDCLPFPHLFYILLAFWLAHCNIMYHWGSCMKAIKIYYYVCSQDIHFDAWIFQIWYISQFNSGILALKIFIIESLPRSVCGLFEFEWFAGNWTRIVLEGERESFSFLLSMYRSCNRSSYPYKCHILSCACFYVPLEYTQFRFSHHVWVGKLYYLFYWIYMYVCCIDTHNMGMVLMVPSQWQHQWQQSCVCMCIAKFELCSM